MAITTQARKGRFKEILEETQFSFDFQGELCFPNMSFRLSTLMTLSFHSVNNYGSVTMS